MARGGWRRHMSKAHHKTSRSTLGNSLPVAVQNVEQLADRVAAATVRLEFDKEQLIHWLFKPDAVQKLCAVKGFVNPSSWRYSYLVQIGVNLSLDFQTSSIVTPMNSAWQPQPEAYPFIETVDKLRGIYHDFMKVMHVMNWMDANATPGAIRQYWPNVCQPEASCAAANSNGVMGTRCLASPVITTKSTK